MYSSQKTDIKSVCLSNFIDQTFQLFDDILRIVPNDHDITTARSYVSTIRHGNPKLIIKSWHECVTLKYKKQIDVGDFEFALNNDYEADVLEHYDKNSESHDYFTKIIEKVRSIASSLNECNRQILIKYLQNLSNLSTVYFQN